MPGPPAEIARALQPALSGLSDRELGSSSSAATANMPVLQHHNFVDDRELGDSAALITRASASTSASLRLQESICVAAAGPELRDAVGGRMSHEVQSTFLPGFI